ncbi:hypothetical protein DESPIG_02153 [Desulfovibrio piger ATCC 29098]|uniref:Uncharacterized protein n=1 Tax=Desulfovibrio piger ATCC 29098 TaxID=411464 RepID=B6WVN5_9BACT|nr:hypothetical protein DESPIG_02153 [Desulfovibrio piger ATCC 29098]
MSASLGWKPDAPDAGCPMAGWRISGAPFAWGSKMSPSRPDSDGDRPYRSEQKFFRGGGEHERGRGSFYQKTPLPLSS